MGENASMGMNSLAFTALHKPAHNDRGEWDCSLGQHQLWSLQTFPCVSARPSSLLPSCPTIPYPSHNFCWHRSLNQGDTPGWHHQGIWSSSSCDVVKMYLCDSYSFVITVVRYIKMCPSVPATSGYRLPWFCYVLIPRSIINICIKAPSFVCWFTSSFRLGVTLTVSMVKVHLLPVFPLRISR